MCGLVPRPAPSPSPSPPPSPLPLFHRHSCNRTTPSLRFLPPLSPSRIFPSTPSVRLPSHVGILKPRSEPNRYPQTRIYWQDQTEPELNFASWVLYIFPVTNWRLCANTTRISDIAVSRGPEFWSPQCCMGFLGSTGEGVFVRVPLALMLAMLAPIDFAVPTIVVFS